MTDTATSNNPFTEIQEREKNAKKTIEKKIHENAEAISEAKIAQHTALDEYEDTVKTNGVKQLKEVKNKALEEKNNTLDTANSEKQSLNSAASSNETDAIKIITNEFEDKILS